MEKKTKTTKTDNNLNLCKSQNNSSTLVWWKMSRRTILAIYWEVDLEVLFQKGKSAALWFSKSNIKNANNNNNNYYNNWPWNITIWTLSRFRPRPRNEQQTVSSTYTVLTQNSFVSAELNQSIKKSEGSWILSATPVRLPPFMVNPFRDNRVTTACYHLKGWIYPAEKQKKNAQNSRSGLKAIVIQVNCLFFFFSFILFTLMILKLSDVMRMVHNFALPNMPVKCWMCPHSEQVHFYEATRTTAQIFGNILHKK